MTKIKILAQIVLTTSLLGNSASAATNSEIQSLRNEFNNIKNSYEKRISDLESNLNKDRSILNNANATRNIYDNKFNPSIGVILNGKYSAFSQSESEFSGFGVGEEGERGKEGFAIGESELNFASNIDDKFYGSVTLAVVNEDGSDIIELEEAYIQTTPAFGLPTGMNLKAGRAFWKFGYLNEHHAHSDDFADRPLPYRVYLNKAFNDDGVQTSYILSTDIYQEIGGGLFRGDDFPLGTGDGNSNYSIYYRVGSDIGDKQNWRLGFYQLSGEAKDGRTSNEDAITFTGDTDLYAVDFKYNFAPTANSKQKELTFQAEYFYREEDGIYNDTDASTGDVTVDNHSSGWYAQTVYRFKPKWRVGLRYSEMQTSDVPVGLNSSVLNANGFDPVSYTAMVDWSNSEFSRVRLQYNENELSNGNEDNQFMFQYIVSFGAHTAHKY
ncbi:MAG: hypothetical protein HOM96_01065 [Rickettsiales bacterium]|jgi:hypothetical protein|nr:hypothetical protein [Rickettsiales bacterium]